MMQGFLAVVAVPSQATLREYCKLLRVYERVCPYFYFYALTRKHTAVCSYRWLLAAVFLYLKTESEGGFQTCIAR